MDNDSLRLIQALAFAAKRHRLQRRKDAEASPYINHPVALVEVLALEAGIDDADVLCAALLHDTIEDTDTTRAELADRFGERVASIVAEVTDDKALPKTERKRLQIEHAAVMSREARLVKLADKICNLRDIAESPPAAWPMARRREYFDWAAQVVDRLRGTHAGLERLFDRAFENRPREQRPAVPGAPVVVGIDGCKNAWLAVSRRSGEATFGLDVLRDARAVLDRFGPQALIAVDIPIGLSDAHARTADRLARTRLGGVRASSVFPTPIRRILHARTRAEASALHKEIDGRGFGAQSFAILPKIREWDEALLADPDARERVREIHPEVCFCELNGGAALQAGKKTPEGQAHRRALLAAAFGAAALADLEGRLDRRHASLDDLFDALAALWSAQRIATNSAQSLPDPPEYDSMGQLRAIWY